MSGIRTSVDRWRHAVTDFEQNAYDDDLHSDNDYAARDDAAVEFATVAADFIDSILETMAEWPELEEEIEASRESETLDSVLFARDAADDLLTRIYSLTKGAHS